MVLLIFFKFIIYLLTKKRALLCNLNLMKLNILWNIQKKNCRIPKKAYHLQKNKFNLFYEAWNYLIERTEIFFI